MDGKRCSPSPWARPSLEELQVLLLNSFRCLRHQSPNSILSKPWHPTQFRSHFTRSLSPIQISVGAFITRNFRIFRTFSRVFFSVSCPRSRESNHIASQGEPSHRVTLSSVSKFFSYLRAASSKIWRNRIAHVKLGFRGGSIHVILAPCPTDPLFLRLCILLKIASCSDHASEAKCSN